jgi:hypothetical protein
MIFIITQYIISIIMIILLYDIIEIEYYFINNAMLFITCFIAIAFSGRLYKNIFNNEITLYDNNIIYKGHKYELKNIVNYRVVYSNLWNSSFFRYVIHTPFIEIFLDNKKSIYFHSDSKEDLKKINRLIVQLNSNGINKIYLRNIDKSYIILFCIVTLLFKIDCKYQGLFDCFVFILFIIITMLHDIATYLYRQK